MKRGLAAIGVCCTLFAAYACARDWPLSDGDVVDAAPDAADVLVEAATLVDNQVSAGNQFTCARTRDTRVFCWGRNDLGQLGRGATGGDEPNPQPVKGLSDVVQVSLGTQHACARLRTGAVTCWGDNQHGQLGRKSVIRDATPGEVPGVNDALAIGTGAYHTCIARAGGDVTCFGRSDAGQVGVRPDAGASNPTNVQTARFPVGEVARFALGIFHSCAWKTDGTVWCWGAAPNGRLGAIGARDGGVWHTAQPHEAFRGVTSFASGSDHVCAIEGAGVARCVGSNIGGQLGSFPNQDPHFEPRVVVDGGALEVHAGGTRTCVTSSEGAIACTGMRFGSPANRAAELAGLRALSMGGDHECGITHDGEVACAGANDRGQIGAGTTDPDAGTVARVVVLPRL